MKQLLNLWDSEDSWGRIPLFDSATKTDECKLPENLFDLTSQDLNKKQLARLVGVIKRSIQI